MTDPTTPEYAAARDAGDPLAGLRDRFLGAETPLVYFDGNSLGRPLRATADRLDRFVREEWGGRLIRGWDEGWFDLPVTIGDDLARVLLGARPGQTAIGDSTTVLLYKLIRAAADHQVQSDPRRTEIVIDRDNFPTDRYVVEGIAAERGLTVRWIEVDSSGGVEVAQVRDVVGPATGVVVLSQVAYRSSHVADAAAITEAVQEAGGLVLWDLCHSAGAVPVELDAWGADLAVGCGYKYLNGGPGAPAFAYVATRHQETLTQPIPGWMGAAEPFRMGPAYQPAPGIRRFISGTPAVVGMLAIRDMVALIEEAGMDAVRAKSVDLTTYAIDLTDAWLQPLGATVGSPREAGRRGGHVTVNHPRMREVTTALWDQDVLPDFRDPDGLRVGLSPLSTSFEEVRRGMEAVRTTLTRMGA